MTKRKVPAPLSLPTPNPTEIREECCSERRLDCAKQSACVRFADDQPCSIGAQSFRMNKVGKRYTRGWRAFSCRKCKAFSPMSKADQLRDSDQLLLLAVAVCEVAHHDLRHARTSAERESARNYLLDLMVAYG